MGGSARDPRYRETPKVYTSSDNPIESEKADEVRVSRSGDVDVFMVRFRSPACDEIFADTPEPGDTETARFDNGANRRFFLRVYASGRKMRHVALLYNGLDETVHQLPVDELLGFYDDLGCYLAKRGILTILLPTPYHMNRVLAYHDAAREQARRDRDGSEYVDFTVPTNGLIRHPYNIYRNHFHGLRETIALCRHLGLRDASSAFPCLLSDPCPFSERGLALIRPLVDADCGVSLIGYSLGGLRALTEFMHDRAAAIEERRAPMFTACVAINSGGALSELPAPPWVDEATWKGMVNELVIAPRTKQRLRGIEEAVHPLAEKHFGFLEDVFLGSALCLRVLEGADKQVGSSLLFILGGGDEIVSLESLKRFAPAGGLNLFQVANMGHLFRHDAWGPWKNTVLELIGRFLDAAIEAALKALTAKELAEFASLLDHHYGVLPYLTRVDERHLHLFEDAANAIKELDSRDLVATVLGSDKLSELAARVSQSEDTVASAIQDFCSGSVLQLSNDIQFQRCHPGIYKATRRSLLLRWHLSHDAALVDHWEAFPRDEGQTIGEALVEADVFPQNRYDTAKAAQEAQLARIRLALANAIESLLRGDDNRSG